MYLTRLLYSRKPTTAQQIQIATTTAAITTPAMPPTYIHTYSITHVAILMSMNHILKKSDTFTEDFGRLGRRSSEQINIVRDVLNCRIPNKWKTDTNI